MSKISKIILSPDVFTTKQNLAKHSTVQDKLIIVQKCTIMGLFILAVAIVWTSLGGVIAKFTAFVRTMEDVKMGRLVELKKLKWFAIVLMDFLEISVRQASDIFSNNYYLLVRAEPFWILITQPLTLAFPFFWSKLREAEGRSESCESAFGPFSIKV